MLKQLSLSSTVGLLTFCSVIHAGGMGPSTENKPEAGLFIGLGGSYNSVKTDQNLFASGVSDVFAGGALTAFGEAGGPANPYHNINSTFAPQVQGGYFKNFTGSDHFWGVKFLYQYLDSVANDEAIDSPQAGTFTSLVGGTTFTGNVIVQSSQVNSKHELALMPFIGHSFMNSVVYLGAGPSVIGARSNIYHSIGYADINGVHADISGEQVNFSNSKWMWGGAMQIGAAYYFSPSWFLDCNYTYSVTNAYKNNNSSGFISSTTSGGTTYTTDGTLFVNASNRVTAQTLSISINKVFAL